MNHVSLDHSSGLTQRSAGVTIDRLGGPLSVFAGA
jgi:hypothetical protein